MRTSKIPTTRRQMIALEKELYAMSHRATDDERRLRLAFAADLLTEARACELYRLCRLR